MGRFNKTAKTPVTKTMNRAGGTAYKQDAKTAFASMLLTSFVKDQFYRNADESIQDIRTHIQEINDPEFAAKSAIYARDEFNMRSVSHVVAGEIAPLVKGTDWGKSFYDKIVVRLDDMLEITSYYFDRFGRFHTDAEGNNTSKRNLPAAMRKGFRKAFTEFDEYQLSKYKAERSDWKLVDLVNMVRPNPTPEQEKALKKLIEGELKSTETWNAKLTEAGKNAKTDEEKVEAKKNVWKDFVAKGKRIEYFALLKNLRNILEQAPEHLDDALILLTDAGLIKNSRVLPFRYITAYEIFEDHDDARGARKVIAALDKAVDISMNNVPKLDGRTVVMLDNSGSMTSEDIFRKASLFTAAILKANPDADLILFSDGANYFNLNTADTISTIQQRLEDAFRGGGTNFSAAFDEATEAYDRIVMISDMQAWVGQTYWGNPPTEGFKRYKSRLNVDPIVFSFDMAGYGDLQFPRDRVYELAGFSEKVFDIMKLLETDRHALVHSIEQVQL